MTQPAQKKLTAADRRLLIEVIDNDYSELLNQLEPQARAWYDAQVVALKKQHGDDSATLDVIAREAEDACQEAQAILDAKLRELEDRGFERHSDTQAKAYFPARWQNAAYASALRSLNQQFNAAVQDGRAAIISARSAAKRRVLMQALEGVGDAAELVKSVPSLEEILGKYLTGVRAIEVADSQR